MESEDDKNARQIVYATIEREGSRYVVGLPWRSPSIVLPNNYDCAIHRLKSVELKFQRDAVFASRYSAIIHDYLKSGFARKLSSHEIKSNSERVWYLPHHGVVNPQKPDKVRVVFDASAKFKNTSLNNVLLKGPNLLCDLPSILMLFREKAVSLSSDIKQMFLQVSVKKEDRSALRFLWREYPSDNSPSIYEMQRQIFGSISSPFICSYVLRKIAIDYADEFPQAAARVPINFYVDNLLDSFNTEDEAIEMGLQMFNLLKKGEFYLTQ